MRMDNLLRENIKKMAPYSSARNEFSGEANVLMDANESPFENGMNRYPDPLQKELKEAIAKEKGIKSNQIFIGNGSDETLDLLFRAFCRPGLDNVVILPPTYGMYKVLADLNDITCKEAPLNKDFSINIERVLAAMDKNTKLLFICSPNNPTGNSIDNAAILRILDEFNGIVVLDEAYIDFSKEKSFTKHLDKYPKLFVNQTLSKSFSGAGLRIGMGFGSEELIQVLNRIKPPYNINTLAQKAGLTLIKDQESFMKNKKSILAEKTTLYQALTQLSIVEEIFPSDANFWLVRFSNADAIYTYLTEQGIIVRNRSKQLHCSNTLRITVGSVTENKLLIQSLSNYNNI